MMRTVLFIVTAALAASGFWFTSSYYPDVTTKIASHFGLRQFYSLEVKYSASYLMEKFRPELIKKSQSHYLDPLLEFYPYALMDVKYSVSHSNTKEAVLLWDLTDGEIVMNTKYWDKTHGFGDCLVAGATAFDFHVLNTLCSKGGSCDEDQLLKGLHVDVKTFKDKIKHCLKKKLIIRNGNFYRPHFQNPKLRVFPETKLEDKLIVKPLTDTCRLPTYFSVNQLEKMGKEAFGQDFTIRKTMLVYLPIHSLIVQNPDGSVQTTLWNALNGKKFPFPLIGE